MLMEKNDIYDEFNHFLQESNKILVEVCLRFTDRQPDNVRDLYQDIVLSLWESWPSFRGGEQPYHVGLPHSRQHRYLGFT